MELSQKLQELRRQKGLTQEELAEILFVSRTAISKWESGRGYPSIDSLKAIAGYFSLTIDDLLSGKELLSIAQKDKKENAQNMRDLVFGLLDCSVLFLLFIPLFGQRDGDIVRQVSLLSLTDTMLYIQVAYFAFVFLSTIWGVATLALQNCDKTLYLQNKSGASAILSILGVLIFIATQEPYVAALVFMMLIIKGVLLLKHP